MVSVLACFGIEEEMLRRVDRQMKEKAMAKKRAWQGPTKMVRFKYRGREYRADYYPEMAGKWVIKFRMEGCEGVKWFTRKKPTQGMTTAASRALADRI